MKVMLNIVMHLFIPSVAAEKPVFWISLAAGAAGHT